MVKLTYPFDESAVRALRAGDAVSVNGLVRTGRDRFHKHFADGGKLPCDFRDGALFHCGPVVVKNPDGPYEPAFIARTGVRLVIGKGGMDAQTLAACAKFGAVYLQAVGGAAAVTAHAIKRVANVYFLEEFGAAEACWEFEVEDFRCVVAMDSHGTSLFAQVEAESRRRFRSLVDGKKMKGRDDGNV